MAEQDMLTAAKLAKEWGVSENLVKKAIKELGIEPDAKKGPCNYYGPKTVAKIKKAVGK
jgi:threonyl-tRNA synthetase